MRKNANGLYRGVKLWRSDLCWVCFSFYHIFGLNLREDPSHRSVIEAKALIEVLLFCPDELVERTGVVQRVGRKPYFNLIFSFFFGSQLSTEDRIQ